MLQQTLQTGTQGQTINVNFDVHHYWKQDSLESQTPKTTYCAQPVARSANTQRSTTENTGC